MTNQDDQSDQSVETQSPASIDQFERARGIWELVVDIDPTDDAKLEALRRALRFPRSDRRFLAERLPGPVRRGASSDLLQIREKLQSVGIAAEVRRTEFER